MAADTDSSGKLIALPAASPADAAAACSADSGCRGFNSRGYFMHSLTPAVDARGVCLYAKKPASELCCPCLVLLGRVFPCCIVCVRVCVWGVVVAYGVTAQGMACERGLMGSSQYGLSQAWA